MKNKVLASRFIEWYFGDHDEVISLGQGCLQQLKNNGKAEVSVEALYDECVYIPKHICLEGQTDDDVYVEEYEPSEVELINDFNNK